MVRKRHRSHSGGITARCWKSTRRHGRPLCQLTGRRILSDVVTNGIVEQVDNGRLDRGPGVTFEGRRANGGFDNDTETIHIGMVGA